MCNQCHGPMTNQSWLTSSKRNQFDVLGHSHIEGQESNFLDEVPIMPSTVLGLEMLLQEPSIDLQAISDLVLSDVGATIHTLRLIGREYESVSEPPSRMGDCIAGLDMARWFETISTLALTCDPANAAATALWRRCQLLGQYTQLVAESMGGIHPEDAYLVGLLHEIGAIPKVLGWSENTSEVKELSTMLLLEEALPPFVLSALQCEEDSNSCSVWKTVLSTAQDLAGFGSIFDSTLERNFELS